MRGTRKNGEDLRKANEGGVVTKELGDALGVKVILRAEEGLRAYRQLLLVVFFDLGETRFGTLISVRRE